ncbi:hypothetical protein ACFXKD_09935 [Nocardiopsis aegyptia]|uniref:hypothetical protein n=1 Tax=Nocardiopsis aegyptia TaxID=220378 RepID=UPI003671B3A7
MLQGGITFAAFGALSVAAAVPAHAENGEVGYAYTSAADEGRIVGFYPRGGDVGGYGGPLYDGEVYSDSIHSVRVDVVEDDLFARVMFRELRIELTEADIEAMREAAEDGVSQPGLENAGGGSEETVLQASFSDPEIAVAQNWAGDREFSHDPGTESVEVNELGAEISFSTETAAWHETREDRSLVYQGLDAEQELWGGIQTLDMVVSFPAEGFSVSYRVGEAIVASDTAPAGDGEGDGDDGDTGGDGTGAGDGDDETPGEGGTDGEGDGNGQDGSGEGDGAGGEGDGDGQDGNGQDGNGQGADSGSEGNQDSSENTAGEGSDDPLAETGSPVAGLIAAGAAVAAGGGAAVYWGRRRKAASAGTEEPSES